MRDPNLLIPTTENTNTIIHIGQIPEYNIQDYDLFDDKQFKKYIGSIEKDIRTSFEYRQMIQYLRDNMSMNTDAFFNTLNREDMTKVKIEIHHDPFDLYGICVVVFNKRRAFNESLEEELVAKEVMFLHYQMLIGLIPLASTVHELVHNQYLFVPTTKIFGRYREFVNLYYDFIPPEQLDTLDRIEEATEAYTDEQYKTVLAKNYIYLDLSDSYPLPTMESIAILLKNRIKEIRESNTGLVEAFTRF